MTAVSPYVAGSSTSPPRQRRRVDPVLVGAGTIILVILVLAASAPLLAPSSPDAVDILSANQGRSGAHWLGTDSLGRDTLTRLLFGARLSLLGPALVAAVATAVGTAAALAGAWIGGWFDRILVRILDIMFALPSLLFAILAVTVLGAGLSAPVLALSLAYIPYVARIIRSVALGQRHLPYIESGQLLGFSGLRTCGHLLRNIGLFVVAQATITFGYALIDLAAISFIGLGVQAPTAEWGLMVSDGATALLNGNGWPALSAGVLIVVTVVAFNVLGERLVSRAEART